MAEAVSTRDANLRRDAERVVKACESLSDAEGRCRGNFFGQLTSRLKTAEGFLEEASQPGRSLPAEQIVALLIDINDQKVKAYYVNDLILRNYEDRPHLKEERKVAYQKTRDYCANYEKKWARIRLWLYQKLAELMPTDQNVLAALHEAEKGSSGAVDDLPNHASLYVPVLKRTEREETDDLIPTDDGHGRASSVADVDYDSDPRQQHGQQMHVHQPPPSAATTPRMTAGAMHRTAGASGSDDTIEHFDESLLLGNPHQAAPQDAPTTAAEAPFSTVQVHATSETPTTATAQTPAAPITTAHNIATAAHGGVTSAPGPAANTAAPNVPHHTPPIPAPAPQVAPLYTMQQQQQQQHLHGHTQAAVVNHGY